MMAGNMKSDPGAGSMSQTLSDMESQESGGVCTLQMNDTDALFKEKFSHDSFSDLTVFAGEEREEIQCHRFVLAKHSEVLRTLLGKRWQGDGEPLAELILPADDPEGFRVMIGYMYTAELKSNLSSHTLIHTLDLAKKYDMPRLTAKIVERLLTCISVHNALSIYFAADLYEIESVKAKAFDIITIEAPAVIQTEEFLNLSYESLHKLLSFDELRVSEGSLLLAVYKWAEATCIINELEVNPENCKLFLKDNLHLIRYGQMTPEQFVDIAEDTDLFEPWEKYEVLYDLLNYPPRKKRPRLTFDYNKTPRHGLLKTYKSRGLFNFGVKHPDRYDNGLATTFLKVDKPISLHTLGIYLPRKANLISLRRSQARYLMCVTIEPEESTSADTADAATGKDKRTCSQYVKLDWMKASYHRFRFDNNMEIVPEKYYKISFSANGFEEQIFTDTDTANFEKEDYKVVCAKTDVILSFKTLLSKNENSNPKAAGNEFLRFQLPQLHFALGKFS